jgi:glycosyltransferase involved in cell wall biosynthesis
VLQTGRLMRAALGVLRGLPALQECFSWSGVRFFDLAAADLAGTLLLQIPWAVRSYEEMSQALQELRPSVVCLYAESSGWGRAAVAACRAHGVPSVGIQHGILYPTYYSYRHDADEADCPRPDRTAVFGEAARRFLIEAGRYAPESLVVTGSPTFDELLLASRTWDRPALRAELGASPDERLIAVASRFRGIRETHQSIGSAFPGLVRAVEGLPRARLLVKPHPAESTDGYSRVMREMGATRARLLDSKQDLMRLMFAADVLVTVESLSAVEALVLGKPVVVLNMPTNLKEMVDAGAALGVPEGQDPAETLSRALEDPGTRERLAAARSAYLNDVASGVDGRATLRLLELLRATAGRAGTA